VTGAGTYPHRMSDYQVTYWRDLPSMVTAREGGAGGATSKALLPPRFQEAIDEAAMRLGDTGADDYLAGWRRGDWTVSELDSAQTLDRATSELDEAWSQERISAYLDALAP
jgi:Virulence factor